jgi:hypothetical protein
MMSSENARRSRAAVDATAKHRGFVNSSIAAEASASTAPIVSARMTKADSMSLPVWNVWSQVSSSSDK